ncbi:MAG: hypothetical protein RL385_888 [Pseudomonadota bacterium]
MKNLWHNMATAGLVLLACGDNSHGARGGGAGAADDVEAGVIGRDAGMQQDRDTGRMDSPSDADAASATDVKLCDGSSGLRLAYQAIVGGTDNNGERLLFENGTHTLYLDGSCRLWVREGQWSAVRTRMMAASDVSALQAGLPLSRWVELASGSSEYCVTEFDSQVLQFLVGSSVFQVGCGRFSSPVLNTSEEMELQNAVLAEIKRLYQSAAPIDGPVRYTLLPFLGGFVSAEDWKGAVAWPLSSNPNELAERRPDPESLPPLTAHQAQGADASKLRALRDRYLAGEIGRFPLIAIPILQPDGSRFMLYLRDEYPFENDGLVTLKGS